jgi:CDP-glucose 4,6-dehydratase
MTKWQNKRVLVTGATGLVGSWLVRRLLNEGASVTALVMDSDPSSELFQSGDISRVSVVNGDLADIKAINRAVINLENEYIFHLGAQTIVGTALIDPVSTFTSNIQGTWNVLEAARISNGLVKSIMVASSDKAYGTAKILPYSEQMPLHGVGPYDVSKSCTDLIAQSYGKTYQLPVVIARCGNIYGGGDLNWSRIVPGTIKSLISGEVPLIRSNGKYLRDYIYVEDAVDAYMHMADAVSAGNIPGEAYNFSRDEPISVLDIYHAISLEVLGEYVEPNILDLAKSEIIDQHLDSTKARKELGWVSKISLNEGLKRTHNWYREYFNRGK